MRLASKLFAIASLATIAAAPRRAPRPEDPAILRIRAHFTRIEKEAPSYRCRSLDLEGFSTEGGTVEACYAGRELRRLSATYFGESGRASEKYYFWNDSLEFLFATTERYDRPLSGRVVKKEEERLYWNGGNLIRWLQGTTARKVSGPDARVRNANARQTAHRLAECAAMMADSVCDAE